MNSTNPKTRFPRYAASCALALGGWLLAGPVSVTHAADSGTDVLSAIVKYTDLDLATHQGSLELYQRIVAAARQVCPLANTADLSALASSRACETRAIARAVSEINSPALAAVYAAYSKEG